MELEFDKEIDAILRKARGGGGVALTAIASPHLDADTIAAFAEDALPQKAKLLYVEHFADCDRCRRMLSQTVLMNSGAVTADAKAASNTILAPVATAVPWYKNLFKTQNLALGMGAIVLAFGGILGYLVLQNQKADTNASVSQVANKPNLGGPYSSGMLNANTSTNAAMPAANAMASPANASAANVASPPAGTASNSAATLPGTTVGRLDSGKATGAGKPADTSSADGFAVDGASKEDSKTVAGAPAPPPASKPEPVRDEKAEAEKSDKLKDGDDAMLATRKRAGEDRYGRDLPAQPSKSGPARSGPIMNQTQGQSSNNSYDMPVKRLVGGKTFENKNGAWYDSAYRGQATSNYRRGTDEYKKLDSGLSNIADTVGGTVVLVWKGKAYRVQ